MIRDLTKRAKVRSEPYMEWVRSLPCVACGVVGRVHAHHCIADRYGSSKHSDLSCIALCPEHHSELHADWPAWEALHGSQWRHVYETLALAGAMGILTIDAKAAREAA